MTNVIGIFYANRYLRIETRIVAHRLNFQPYKKLSISKKDVHDIGHVHLSQIIEL